MRETSRNDEVAVRQRLARLRREPAAGPAREIVPPLPRTAAAVPALPGAVTTASSFGTAAASLDRAVGRAPAPLPGPPRPGVSPGPRPSPHASVSAGGDPEPDERRRPISVSVPAGGDPDPDGRPGADPDPDGLLRRGRESDGLSRRGSESDGLSRRDLEPGGPAGRDLQPEERDGPEAVPRPSRFGGASAFDPGRRGTRALAAVALLVVIAAAVLAWRARPRPDTVTVEPAAQEEASGAPASSAGAGDVVVAVAGKVRRPGLVRLPAGARVADAIEAAGGALAGADVTLLNLARKVNDGELILVGVTAPPGASDAGATGGGTGDGGATGGGAAQAGGDPASGGKVNLNTATLAQLDALPGVGPVLAQRILDHRQRHGTFRSVSDLRQVDGIGDARYEQLRELVTV